MAAAILCPIIMLGFVVVFIFMIKNNHPVCFMPEHDHIRSSGIHASHRNLPHIIEDCHVHSGYKRHLPYDFKDIGCKRVDYSKRHIPRHPRVSNLAWRWIRLLFFDLTRETPVLDCESFKNGDDHEIQSWFEKKKKAAMHRFQFNEIESEEYACAEVQVITMQELLPAIFPRYYRNKKHTCYNKSEICHIQQDFVDLAIDLGEWIKDETFDRGEGDLGPQFGCWTSAHKCECKGMKMHWLDWEDYNYYESLLPKKLEHLFLDHLNRARICDPKFYEWNAKWTGKWTDLHVNSYQHGLNFIGKLS